MDTVNHLVIHMVDSHGSSPGCLNHLVNMNDLLNYPLNYPLFIKPAIPQVIQGYGVTLSALVNGPVIVARQFHTLE